MNVAAQVHIGPAVARPVSAFGLEAVAIVLPTVIASWSEPRPAAEHDG